MLYKAINSETVVSIMRVTNWNFRISGKHQCSVFYFSSKLASKKIAKELVSLRITYYLGFQLSRVFPTLPDHLHFLLPRRPKLHFNQPGSRAAAPGPAPRRPAAGARSTPPRLQRRRTPPLGRVLGCKYGVNRNIVPGKLGHKKQTVCSIYRTCCQRLKCLFPCSFIDNSDSQAFIFFLKKFGQHFSQMILIYQMLFRMLSIFQKENLDFGAGRKSA